MPTPVDKYFEEIKRDNPSYSDEQAWATAWSIYCKHKNPGSDHCHKPTGEYLKGREASMAERLACCGQCQQCSKHPSDQPDPATQPPMAVRLATAFMGGPRASVSGVLG